MRLNNKGFTLIEVLLVVAILSVLALIMIPTVGNLIEQNRSDNFNNLKNSIISAAKLHVSDNRYSLGISCQSGDPSFNVTLRELVDEGSLSENVIDPRDKQAVDLDGNYVTVTYDCNTKEFSYVIGGVHNWESEEDIE